LKWHEGTFLGAVVLFKDCRKLWLTPEEYHDFMVKYLPEEEEEE
jgi:heme oxygenase